MAPGVKFVALDVFDPQGNAYFTTIVKAVDWAVANKAKYNVTVINMSLGAEEDPGGWQDLEPSVQRQVQSTRLAVPAHQGLWHCAFTQLHKHCGLSGSCTC